MFPFKQFVRDLITERMIFESDYQRHDPKKTVDDLDRLANHPSTHPNIAAVARQKADELRKKHGLDKEGEQTAAKHASQSSSVSPVKGGFKWSHELKQMPQATFAPRTKWTYSKGPRDHEGNRPIKGHIFHIKDVFAVSHKNERPKPVAYKTFKDAHDHLVRHGYTKE